MASEEFDPYYKWLGIPPAEQPPNHYRLLGIELFESDLEVIESAADQRMAHLRTFQGGRNAKLSQKLLNEVSKARICLLKPDTKLSYDESLGIPQEGAADPSGPPPIQIPPSIPRYKSSSPLKPVLIIACVLLVGVGAVYAIIQSSGNKDGDSDVAQKKEKDDKDQNKGSGNDADDSQSTDQSKKKEDSLPDKSQKQNSTDGNSENPKTNNAGDGDSKKKDDEPKKQGDPPKKTDDVKKMKDPDKSNPSDPEKTKDKDDSKDKSPLIIGSTSNKKTETLVRAPIPPADRWKPFVSVLKRDFAIKDDLTRDSRFVLFNELIKNGSEEIRPDKAYALFNIAMDQARKLNHIGGVKRYCSAFSERFEFEKVAAEVAFLNSIIQGIESKPHVAKLLNQCLRHIRDYERDQNYSAAINLLSGIVSLADKPIGKDINKDFFENWLVANVYRQKIVDSLANLLDLKKKNKLTPAQQRVLGTYECFVNDDWDAGFEHYLQCDFKPIADLAKKAKEVNVSDVHSIAEIADLWWVLSTKVKDEEYLFKMRSKYWYDEYAKLVNASEISKKILKRMEELNVGLGLKRMPVARSPSQVLFLDFENELTPGATTEPTYIEFVNNNLIAILSKEDSMGSSATRFRVVQIDSQTDAFSDESTGFIKHRIVSFGGKLAYLQSRSGIQAMGSRAFSGNGQGNSSSQRKLRTREVIRAFDIDEKGNVFALADKFVYWWNAQQAWGQGNSSNRNPNKFDSPVAFIANQIRIIPNSSSVAISDHRTLVRVNLTNKSITEIHTSGKLIDYDFAPNGNGVATGLENGVRYKAFKGNKNLFFQTNEVTKVRFLPNSRFIVSLHKDHSIRVWDVFQKSNDYLVDKFDSDDFRPIDFSLSGDGSTIAMTDDSTRIKFLTLFYE